MIIALVSAIGLNAIYGVLGMLCSTFVLSYSSFLVIPYPYNNGSLLLEPGFYSSFSPALFGQTNAAGAIFAASSTFFLYGLLSDSSDKLLSKIGLLFSLLGLFLTRALAPMLLTFVLSFLMASHRTRRLMAYAALLYMAIVVFTADGILGVNLHHINNKINTSALVKLDLLIKNLGYIMDGHLLGLLFPVQPSSWSTENSFIDIVFQYGLIPTVLFYWWCVKQLILKPQKHSGILLLSPLLLSFMQNSALTTPSVIILGLSLGLYGDKTP